MAETNYLKNFIDDEVITASDTNNNNQYLLSQISDNNAAVRQYVAAQIASINSSSQTTKAALEEEIEAVDAKVDAAIHLKTTYINGTSGYNIWSNGYCEQWGRTNNGGSSTTFNITLLKKYADTNYSISGSSTYGQTAGDKRSTWAGIPKTADTLQIITHFEQYAAPVMWQTRGYLAEGEY